MPYFGVGLHILIAIFFAIHAVRNRREMYWLMILFAFPLLGSVVYFFAIYLPDSRLHHGMRKATVAAIKSLDPGRELRDAQQAFELTPSAQNQMRLAAACLEAGDASQAALHYETCLKGPFAKEPEMLLGAAKARFQNAQATPTIELLNKVRRYHPQFRNETVGLLLAQAYALEGNRVEARNEFLSAVNQFGSVDAYAEYAIWACSIGEIETANVQQRELEKMQKHWNQSHFSMHKPLLKRLEDAFALARKN